ncbi:MAG: molybdopterin-dependent oxidoreductase [Chloroflexi bacterium]|nr:molybdopterin-dependent oxidoreductase [Chloroflexota bacterium]
MSKAIGSPHTRLDIVAKVKGTRKYPQDFNMEGQLWAAVVWAAHPHAIVRRIDTSAAEALPGVVRILTSNDVPVNSYGINIPDQPVLVGEGEKVRWVGDRIAIVVAQDRRTAYKARDLVQVDYEPLPVVSDVFAAMQENAPRIHEDRPSNILHHIPIRKGNIEEGFAQADVIVESEISTPFVEHAYMQPEAGIGYIDEEGRVTVIASAQWPHDDLHQIARMLDLPEDKVREIVPAVGGAFGGREDMYIQHLLALCAFVMRRPVKMVWDREESITRTGKRHPFYFQYKVGATREGILTAVQIRLVSDAGAYASTSVPVLNNAASFAAGPYKYPHAHVDAYTVFTNNAVTMAMRGFGATQPPVMYERMLDQLAEALHMDPVELRMKNLLGDGDISITGNAMWGGVGIKETLRQAALAAGWRQEGEHWVKPDLGQPSAPHKKRGIGIACAYKNVGYSFGFDDKSEAEVILRLKMDGSIASATVKTAAVEVGQGVTTALAQIAAETLGIPVSRVRIALIDTSDVPNAGSSSASRHVYITGNAVYGACKAALEKRERILLEESGEPTVSARYLYHGRSHRPTTPYDPETGQCNPHIAYSYGTEIALVEVDTETGETEVLKMWAAHDAGRVVNPAQYFGQVAGGVHMGVGYGLTEEYMQQDARPRTRHFSEYFIPTVLDMPRELVSLAVEVEDPTGPFGAKGLGETPTLPTAAAIANAIHDATGVWLNRIPATSEMVWRAIHSRG